MHTLIMDMQDLIPLVVLIQVAVLGTLTDGVVASRLIIGLTLSIFKA